MTISTKMHQESFNDKFRRRTKLLALEIIKIISPLKYSDTTSVFRKQIIRSSTSVAANFRAVCRGRSEKERFAKLCIVVEEADETLFWIEMFRDTNLMTNNAAEKIEKEATEILKVMSSYKNQLRRQA